MCIWVDFKDINNPVVFGNKNSVVFLINFNKWVSGTYPIQVGI